MVRHLWQLTPYETRIIHGFGISDFVFRGDGGLRALRVPDLPTFG
jgi:hypothetical protein